MAALIAPTQAVPALQPLARSHAADPVEAELKALFMSIFEDVLRARERRINALGMPHVGDFPLIERSIKQDGLALYRGADQQAMRYLHKAWRARNPRRGLAFMRCYLQQLFPNAFAIVQQWQDRAKPYPVGLADQDGGNHYLTSRVSVRLSTADTLAVLAIVSALRSVAPARVVLTVQIVNPNTAQTNITVGSAGAGVLLARYTGNIN